MSDAITLILPLSPFLKCSGGSAAIARHLEEFVELESSFRKYCVIFLDHEEALPSPQTLSECYKGIEFILVRKVNDKSSNPVRYYLYTLFSILPFDVLHRARNDAANDVLKIIENSKIVVYDHLYSIGIFPSVSKIRTLIYMAHNIESEILKQRYRATKVSLLKAFYFLDYWKMRLLEKSILKRSRTNIFISGNDYQSARGLNKNSYLCTELMPPQQCKWKYTGSNNILFIGGSKYFPNLDAIRWLSNELAPRLASSEFAIKVVGNVEPEVKREYEKPNVIFTGFLSDDDLNSELTTCAIFISPIVLGSGIKIKMLEALCRGVPVICTSESLVGLDSIKTCLLFKRDNPDRCALDILHYANDPAAITSLSDSTYASYINLFRMRNSWTKFLGC